MRFCDFIKKLKPCFACSSQEAFVLDVFSALCAGNAPVGLTGDDASYRKLLFSGKNRKYSGLSNPIKSHVLGNKEKSSFISYCEAKVSVESFNKLCADFGVSADVGRVVMFEGIFEQFLEFAKSGDDNTADSFIADHITQILMNPPNADIAGDITNELPDMLCAGDDFTLVRQSASSAYTAAFYDKLTHYWVIKNSGVVIWDGRYMEFINQSLTPLKTSPSRFYIEKTPPGGEVVIKIDIDARHIEGIHEIILDMKDSEGRDCFPDGRAKLQVSVAVGWTK